MKIEREKWITREMVRANPDKVFLFGDNVERRGMGGQAREMRGEPNAFGVPTKLSPQMNEHAFFSDLHLAYNCERIDQSLEFLKDINYWDKTIVIPADGLGTGLAELDKRAPKTFAYLEKRLAELEDAADES